MNEQNIKTIEYGSILHGRHHRRIHLFNNRYLSPYRHEDGILYGHPLLVGFLVAGIICIGAAFLVANVLFSAILGVVGASCLWSIGELFEQRQRCEKGWFPKNPKRIGTGYYRDEKK